jgi:hypothetical protein
MLVSLPRSLLISGWGRAFRRVVVSRPPRVLVSLRHNRSVLGHGWQTQWARVHRRLDDVRAVYTGRVGGTDAAVDTVQSFFEAAHHLKDWLGNDPSSGVTKDAGDSLISASPVLQLCADLANGSKHLVLTSARTGDTSTTIARNDVTVFAGTGTSAHRFYVVSAGTEYDVLQLAEAAVREWTKFLSARGLI